MFTLFCRDLKSLNILLRKCATSSSPDTARYQVCLGDLGTMSCYERGSPHRLGGFSGTHEYMAPEVLKVKEKRKLAELLARLQMGNLNQLGSEAEYDEKVDVWSAQMTLVDMLSGLQCAGLELLRNSVRAALEGKPSETPLGDFAVQQLQELAGGKHLPLGQITHDNFEYYRPVLEHLIPLMSGLRGQQRSSAHALLPVVRQLKWLYECSCPVPLRKVEFCL